MLDFKALIKHIKKSDTVLFKKYDEDAYISDTYFLAQIDHKALDELLLSLHVIPKDIGRLTIIKGKVDRIEDCVPDMRNFLKEAASSENMRVFNSMELVSIYQNKAVMFFSDGTEISMFNAALLGVFSNPTNLRQTHILSPGIVEISGVPVGMISPIRMELPAALEELKRLRAERKGGIL